MLKLAAPKTSFVRTSLALLLQREPQEAWPKDKVTYHRSLLTISAFLDWHYTSVRHLGQNELGAKHLANARPFDYGLQNHSIRKYAISQSPYMDQELYDLPASNVSELDLG